MPVCKADPADYQMSRECARTLADSVEEQPEYGIAQRFRAILEAK